MVDATSSGAHASFSNRDFRDVMGRFATGVAIVTTRAAAGAPVGMTVNSFSAVSLSPPLVLFCIDRGATCYDAFAAADCFAVNILREDQQAISDVFANGDGDRFAGLAVDRWETGAPILTAGLAAMDCQIHDRHDGGDHDILVGRVLRLSTGAAAAPLVYFGGRYQALAAD